MILSKRKGWLWKKPVVIVWSIFGFLIEKQSNLLVLGLDYKNTYTLVHSAEQEVGVNYRYFKNFKGDYIDQNNEISKKEFIMYVSPNVTISPVYA